MEPSLTAKTERTLPSPRLSFTAMHHMELSPSGPRLCTRLDCQSLMDRAESPPSLGPQKLAVV